MIWHVLASDFIAFLEEVGFSLIAETSDQRIYSGSGGTVVVRRSPTLTQAEVDVICDIAGLNPPAFHNFFGD